MGKKPRKERNSPPLGPPPPIVDSLSRLAGELELKHRNGASEAAIYEAARIGLSSLTMTVLQRISPPPEPPRYKGKMDDTKHPTC